jgi:hypothetical protein
MSDFNSNMSIWDDYDQYSGNHKMVSKTNDGQNSSRPLSISPNGWTHQLPGFYEIVELVYTNRTEIIFPSLGMRVTQLENASSNVTTTAIDGKSMTVSTESAPEYSLLISSNATAVTSHIAPWDLSRDVKKS